MQGEFVIANAHFAKWVASGRASGETEVRAKAIPASSPIFWVPDTSLPSVLRQAYNHLDHPRGGP
jgi:hypothetical protein